MSRVTSKKAGVVKERQLVSGLTTGKYQHAPVS